MAGGAAPIYVEILIRAPLDEVWRRTQEPAVHERWDARFSAIRYLPRADDREPQRFRYETRIGFGLRIAGEGESHGTRDGEDGARTSSLKFWSDDAMSLIREGSGYWKYVPGPEGVRFLTWYDYRVRYGWAGRLFDRVLFRPLIAWATAWSFDRLRLWIERGLDPAAARDHATVHAVARATLAFVFLYHGLVPKLIARHPDEAAMLAQGGLGEALIGPVLVVFAIAEMMWAIVLLASRARWPLLATAAAMPLVTLLVALRSPGFLTGAFNAVTLNLCVAALAVVAWVAGRELPSASRCLRRPPAEQP